MKKTVFAYALFALFVGSAQAASSGAASLTDFRISLVDLDPSDGVVPSLEWWYPLERTQVSGTTQAPYIIDPNGNYAQSTLAFGSGLFSPVAVSFDSALGGHSASIDGSGLFATSYSSAALDYATEPSFVNSHGWSQINGAVFTLSKNTAVTFRAIATISGNLAVSDPQHIPSEWTDSSAGMSAYLSGQDSVGESLWGPLGFPYGWNDLTGEFDLWGVPTEQSTFRTVELSITLANTGEEISYGAFSAYAASNSATTWSPIVAIPEAETYAMLLAGLGVLSARARRKKLATQ